jgi:MinD superfamily P-loop ATPase
MVVTIASGKGGTGKTTIATNLASIIDDLSVTFLDCDVEEPNGHLFLKPTLEKEWSYHTFIPEVDQAECTFCGRCSELCQFGAITTLRNKVLVFPDLCHGCEGCKLICPVDAITEGQKEVGNITYGKSDQIRFLNGHLRVGEAMSPPLIREVKRIGLSTYNSGFTIIDAPPGTSCPVIEAIKGSDYVILVTEPTPFGFHDLKLAVSMVRILHIPFGVVINRATLGDHKVWNFCETENIPILLEIPDDRKIAEDYSRGKLIIQTQPFYQAHFETLYREIKHRLDLNREK